MDATYDTLNASKSDRLFAFDVATYNCHTETRLLELMKDRIQSEHSGLQLANLKEASSRPIHIDSFTHQLCAGSNVVDHFPTDIRRGAPSVASDQR
jgi:hypothetical protein